MRKPTNGISDPTWKHIYDRDAEITRLESEYRDCLQTITDMQSKWEEVQAENERLRKQIIRLEAAQDVAKAIRAAMEGEK